MTEQEETEMVARLNLEIEKMRSKVKVTGAGLPDDILSLFENALVEFRGDAEGIIRQARLRDLPDSEVRKAFLETNGEDSDPWVKALLAEIERRQIDL